MLPPSFSILPWPSLAIELVLTGGVFPGKAQDSEVSLNKVDVGLPASPLFLASPSFPASPAGFHAVSGLNVARATPLTVRSIDGSPDSGYAALQSPLRGLPPRSAQAPKDSIEHDLHIPRAKSKVFLCRFASPRGRPLRRADVFPTADLPSSGVGFTSPFWRRRSISSMRRQDGNLHILSVGA